ncbi:BlaI/MecI/CopY family transcriptional regulator [Streptomyces niveus]
MAAMRAFGELEAEIMRVVWQRDRPVTIHALTDALNGSRTLAYTTVMTVTERLRDKGWLTREKHGRSYQYSAARSSDDYSAELMGQVLDAAADRAGALLRFAGRLDPREAAALREALAAPPADTPPQSGG